MNNFKNKVHQWNKVKKKNCDVCKNVGWLMRKDEDGYEWAKKCSFCNLNSDNKNKER